MKIFANTIVNNEENFIWFALMSVVDYVDKVLIWNTGSTDKTVEIIKIVAKNKGNKIEFKEVGVVDENEFTVMRQRMLDESKCDWILVLDGDEVWWEGSIEKMVSKIQRDGEKIDGIVVPMIVPVGDIYHRQEEVAGKYKLIGKRGHYTLRALSKKIPGLHVDWPYGKESYLGKDNRPIQDRKGIVFLDAPYLHVTHLKRSSKLRKFNKFKYELGSEFPKNFKYPEVFYKPYPKIIPGPWIKPTKVEKVRMYIETPLRKIKRKIL